MIRLAFAFLLTLCVSAQAQLNGGGTGFPGPGMTASASYSGPVDVVGSPLYAYALRAISSADRGNAIINLCDDAGANCADIATDATTGAMNNPGTLGANNCATSNTCRVKTWYDRSGANSCGGSACNVTQATTANMPTLTWSCINSKPCLVFGATHWLGSAATAPSFTGGTLSAVSQRTGAFTTAANIISVGNTGSQGNLNYRQVANTLQMFLGTAGQTVGNITDSNYHTFQAVFNGASSVLVCGGGAGSNCSTGGTATSISPGTTATGINTAVCIGAGTAAGPCNGTSNPLTGQLTEALGYSTVFNATQYGNMTTNQYAYWGPF